MATPLDLLLGELVDAEKSLAEAAIAAGDPVTARLEAQGRHEALVDATQQLVKASVACRKGCSFCCHFRVAAPVHEVLALAAWIQRHLPPDAVTRVREAARRNTSQLLRLTPGDRLRVNLPCPVLTPDGACAAWPARPSRCRSYHAVDVEGCKDAYEHPGEPGAPHRQVAELKVVAEALGNGFHEATVAAGYDDRQVELASGLLEALSGSGPAERYRRRQVAFQDALVFATPGRATG